MAPSPDRTECEELNYTAAAKANGATDEEIREAIAMAAIVRHWSRVLNGSQIDFATFKHPTRCLNGQPTWRNTGSAAQ